MPDPSRSRQDIPLATARNVPRCGTSPSHFCCFCGFLSVVKLFKMLGTCKNHVLHVKWKMFPDVPPTCSHMFPNTLFVIPDVLDKQRVGEHVRVTGYKLYMCSPTTPLVMFQKKSQYAHR